MRRGVLPGLAAAAAFLLAAAAPCAAQSSFPTPNPNVNAPGAVSMCLDPSGSARPCDGLTPLAVKVLGPAAGLPYPPNAMPITGIATGTTGAVTATLAAFPGKNTYICGFDVSAIGGTAAVGPITVTGLTGGTFTYQLSSSAAGVTFSRTFTPCIPGTLNTAITIVTTANGTATAVDVNAWGFQL